MIHSSSSSSSIPDLPPVFTIRIQQQPYRIAAPPVKHRRVDGGISTLGRYEGGSVRMGVEHYFAYFEYPSFEFCIAVVLLIFLLFGVIVIVIVIWIDVIVIVINVVINVKLALVHGVNGGFENEDQGRFFEFGTVGLGGCLRAGSDEIVNDGEERMLMLMLMLMLIGCRGLGCGCGCGAGEIIVKGLSNEEMEWDIPIDILHECGPLVVMSMIMIIMCLLMLILMLLLIMISLVVFELFIGLEEHSDGVHILMICTRTSVIIISPIVISPIGITIVIPIPSLCYHIHISIHIIHININIGIIHNGFMEGSPPIRYAPSHHIRVGVENGSDGIGRCSVSARDGQGGGCHSSRGGAAISGFVGMCPGSLLSGSP
jgi:hypothetical protein